MRWIIIGKIRILQVIDYFDINSGVSAVLMNFYKHMDFNLVQFDFLVHDKVGREYEDLFKLYNSNCYVVSMPNLRNIKKYINELNYFFKEHNNYDIVHGHMPNAAIFYLSTAKKYGIKKRIIHSHNSAAGDTLKKTIRNKLLYSGIPFVATDYFACSDKAAEFLFKKNAKKATIIFNGVELEKYKFSEKNRIDARRQLNIDEDTFVIGNIGRFCEQKNHMYMLAIFEEILKRRPKSKFILVGEGHLKEKFQESTIKKGINDKFILLNSITDVEKYLSAMDIFVLPSKYEGLPVVGVEAQANGLKCIFSDKITRQTLFKGGNSKFIGIKREDIEKWVESMLESDNTRVTVIDKEFDIRNQARIISEKYIDILKN